MLFTTAVDHMFVAWSGKTKDCKMCICCFSARHTALRGKRAKTDWLRTWIICLSGETSSSFHGNVICSRHAWYSWNLFSLGVNNNHSLILTIAMSDIHVVTFSIYLSILVFKQMCKNSSYCEIIINRRVLVFMDLMFHLIHKN